MAPACGLVAWPPCLLCLQQHELPSLSESGPATSGPMLQYAPSRQGACLALGLGVPPISVSPLSGNVLPAAGHVLQENQLLLPCYMCWSFPGRDVYLVMVQEGVGACQSHATCKKCGVPVAAAGGSCAQHVQVEMVRTGTNAVQCCGHQAVQVSAECTAPSCSWVIVWPVLCEVVSNPHHSTEVCA